MYDFILQIIIMASLAAMIYLMARAIPRVSETAAPVNQKNYADELVKRIPFDKIDALINAWAAKFLRKAKILVLKLDNRISDSLTKFKANGNGKEVLNRDILSDSKPIDFVQGKEEKTE